MRELGPERDGRGDASDMRNGRRTPVGPDTSEAPEQQESATVRAVLAGVAPRIELLRQLAEGDGLTAAAQRARIPQPTATRWLAEAGAALGTDIAVRAGRGIELTRAGELLVEGSRSALAELTAAVRAAVEETDPQRGTVALGFLHTLGETRVPRLIGGFRHSFPHVRFHLSQTFHEDLLDRLRGGGIDLALTAPLPDEPGEDARGLDWALLYRQPVRVVVPRGHRLDGRTRVRLADLSSETFISLKRGYGLRHITDGLFAEAGFTPDVAFEGEDVDTVRGLVGANLGIALLPAGGHGQAAGTTEVDVSPAAHRGIGLVWSASRPLPPAAEAFRDHAVAAGR